MSNYRSWDEIEAGGEVKQRENTPVDTDYSQVCVWQGTLLKEEQHEEFKQFMKDELGVRVQILEVIFTFPTGGTDTGGRSDIFFAVHKEDMGGSFAIKRLSMGIRWIEDVLSPTNYSEKLYPSRVYDYKTWEA